jgi:hypothetical protein
LRGEKATLNWATTAKFAEKFSDPKIMPNAPKEGRKLVSRQVPIEDIVATNFGKYGKYEEFIVFNHDAKIHISADYERRGDKLVPKDGSERESPRESISVPAEVSAAAEYKPPISPITGKPFSDWDKERRHGSVYGSRVYYTLRMNYRDAAGKDHTIFRAESQDISPKTGELARAPQGLGNEREGYKTEEEALSVIEDMKKQYSSGSAAA